jgi:hypothetical protein
MPKEELTEGDLATTTPFLIILVVVALASTQNPARIRKVFHMCLRPMHNSIDDAPKRGVILECRNHLIHGFKVFPGGTRRRWERFTWAIPLESR